MVTANKTNLLFSDRILNVCIVLRWPCAVDGTLKSKNWLTDCLTDWLISYARNTDKGATPKIYRFSKHLNQIIIIGKSVINYHSNSQLASSDTLLQQNVVGVKKHFAHSQLLLGGTKTLSQTIILDTTGKTYIQKSTSYYENNNRGQLLCGLLWCLRRTQLELYICLFQTHTIRTVYICLFQTHTMRNLAVFVLLLAMVGLNTAYWIDGM